MSCEDNCYNTFCHDDTPVPHCENQKKWCLQQCFKQREKREFETSAVQEAYSNGKLRLDLQDLSNVPNDTGKQRVCVHFDNTTSKYKGCVVGSGMCPWTYDSFQQAYNDLNGKWQDKNVYKC